QSGKQTLILKGHTRAVYSVSFSDDGKQIVSGSEDHTVKVWDAKSGQELLSLKGHTTPVVRAYFTPNGKRVVSSDSNGHRIVWDLSTGKSLPNGREPDRNVQFVSPDGRWIVVLAPQRQFRVVRLLKANERPRLRRLGLPDPAWHERQARDSEERL